MALLSSNWSRRQEWGQKEWAIPCFGNCPSIGKRYWCQSATRCNGLIAGGFVAHEAAFAGFRTIRASLVGFAGLSHAELCTAVKV